jgi:hypothetical protein
MEGVRCTYKVGKRWTNENIKELFSIDKFPFDLQYAGFIVQAINTNMSGTQHSVVSLHFTKYLGQLSPDQ